MDFAEPLIPLAETRSEQAARRVAWAQAVSCKNLSLFVDIMDFAFGISETSPVTLQPWCFAGLGLDRPPCLRGPASGAGRTRARRPARQFSSAAVLVFRGFRDAVGCQGALCLACSLGPSQHHL